MSKTSDQKGRRGEHEFAEYLTSFLGKYGYVFVRRGGQESSKQVLNGDVVMKPTPKYKQCILEPYFLESKLQKNPAPLAALTEAEENATKYGKYGAIVRVKQLGRGINKCGIITSEDTFKKIVEELQGYREKL